MVSLNGVEPPLAGGPQKFGFGVRPSEACISRARFEYGLAAPSSCDGDPAPDLAFAVAALPTPLLLPAFPKVDRTALPDGASIGDVLAVDDPDRGGGADN